MHRGKHAGAGQEGAEDDQRVGQHDQDHVPMLEQTLVFLDHDRVQEGSAGQPGHEGRDLDRVPAPEATPTQHVVSPAAAKHETQREEQPGPQRPAAGEARPAVVGAPGDQRSNREGKGNHERDKTQVQHGRVDDHAWMPQERIKAAPVWGGESHAAGRLEGSRHNVTCHLPETGKRILEEDVHREEESQRYRGDHDHPGQKFAVTFPLTQGDRGGKRG